MFINFISSGNGRSGGGSGGYRVRSGGQSGGFSVQVVTIVVAKLVVSVEEVLLAKR